jgi:hypothetical protein
MNALELADKQAFETGELTMWIRNETATMLRQQQAVIEAFKAPKIPLLEHEIRFILGNGQCWTGEDCSMPNLMYIIRAVEAAHGIGVY